MSELVHIKGFKELDAMLKNISAKLEANVMRGALRAGAMVVLREARANVPLHTGTLKRGMRVTTRLSRGVVSARVRTTGKHAYLARWLEFGVAAHAIVPKKSKSLFFGGKAVAGVDHPGIRARPFMRPALASQQGAALVAVGEAIKRRLNKAGLDASDIDIEVGA